jgi:hypothetical protein
MGWLHRRGGHMTYRLHLRHLRLGAIFNPAWVFATAGHA